jgi:hypothetical protein
MSVRTSQEAHYVSAAKANPLMLFTKKVAVSCQNRIKTQTRFGAWAKGRGFKLFYGTRRCQHIA